MIPALAVDRDALKLLANLAMLVDHVGAIFFPQHLELRIVGRLSYPLFLLLLVDGLSRTRDVYRFQVRLLVLAVLSEVPYLLAFGHHGNVVAAFALAVWATRGRTWRCVLVALVLHFGRFDYGWVTVFALVAPDATTRWLFVSFQLIQRGGLMWHGLGSALMPLVRIEHGARWLPSWLGWTFYPLHLVLLVLLRAFLTAS